MAAAADYFFTGRFTSTLSALFIGAIPVDRTKVSRQTLEDCHRLLADGWSLALYPEGGRSVDGSHRRVQGRRGMDRQEGQGPRAPPPCTSTAPSRVLPKGGQAAVMRHPVTISFGTPVDRCRGRGRSFLQPADRASGASPGAPPQAPQQPMSESRLHHASNPLARPSERHRSITTPADRPAWCPWATRRHPPGTDRGCRPCPPTRQQAHVVLDHRLPAGPRRGRRRTRCPGVPHPPSR